VLGDWCPFPPQNQLSGYGFTISRQLDCKDLHMVEECLGEGTLAMRYPWKRRWSFNIDCSYGEAQPQPGQRSMSDEEMLSVLRGISRIQVARRGYAACEKT
jgi:hypothetical protein